MTDTSPVQGGTGHAGHAHGHGSAHPHGPGRPGQLRRLARQVVRQVVPQVVRPHAHEAADRVDAALEASEEGMRALWISLAVLAVTALVQALVVLASGSVALLGDTLHTAATGCAHG